MSRFKRLSLFLVTVLFFGGLALASWQHWTIYDWWQLRNYSAPADISQLARDTTMNNTGQRLFYVYHPQLDKKSDFVQHCESAERTIVLGCYVPAKGIYLQDIDDERLEGVLQVTAAHEMLHAAYDRLNSSERSHINTLLNQAYGKVTDKRIRATIQDYKSDGADVTNELHSILATEVRNLPKELEDYYSRYFFNRSKIVAYSEQYEAAFTKRKQQVSNYDKQLAQLKQHIDALQSILTQQTAQLEADHAELQRNLAAKNYQAYNTGVPRYNQAVNEYNANVQEIRTAIAQYNTIVEKRNNVALEENELVKAIDSRPSTLEKQ